HTCAPLALAALHAQALPHEREELLRSLEAHQTQLGVWAENAPENFAHRHALVSAEIARLRGDDAEAMQLYERAIRSARQNGFVQDEGLSYEFAARFYRQRGFDVFADAYVREERSCYAKWGADAKVRDLERRHPQLVENAPQAIAPFIGAAAQLDLLAVLKA